MFEKVSYGAWSLRIRFDHVVRLGLNHTVLSFLVGDKIDVWILTKGSLIDISSRGACFLRARIDVKYGG